MAANPLFLQVVTQCYRFMEAGKQQRYRHSVYPSKSSLSDDYK